MTYLKIWLFIGSAFLQGCVGVLVTLPEQNSSNVKELQFKTKEQVRAGQPFHRELKISKTTNGELWSYDQRIWCGVVVSVIVPIPLMLPVCEESVTYRFVGDKPVERKEKEYAGFGYMCSIVPGTKDGDIKYCGNRWTY